MHVQRYISKSDEWKGEGKILWDFDFRGHKLLQHWRLSTVSFMRIKLEWLILDVVVPGILHSMETGELRSTRSAVTRIYLKRWAYSHRSIRLNSTQSADFLWRHSKLITIEVYCKSGHYLEQHVFCVTYSWDNCCTLTNYTKPKRIYSINLFHIVRRL